MSCCYMNQLIYLFTPQRVVVCTLCKQEVLQQPEEPNETGTERQERSLGVPQVWQWWLQHHLQQADAQSSKQTLNNSLHNKTVLLDIYNKVIQMKEWFCLFFQLRDRLTPGAFLLQVRVTNLRLMSSGGRTSWQEEPSLVRTENTCPRSLHTTSSAPSAPLPLHRTENTMLVSRLHSSSSGVCCSVNNSW